MTVRKLENEINKNGYIYRLVERNDSACIYAQHMKSGEIIAYEVFKIKLNNLKKVNQRYNKPTDNCEDYYEKFPGNSEFGKRAWTYPNLELAKIKYNSIT